MVNSILADCRLRQLSTSVWYRVRQGYRKSEKLRVRLLRKIRPIWSQWLRLTTMRRKSLEANRRRRANNAKYDSDSGSLRA
jgi:hypothetical protein